MDVSGVCGSVAGDLCSVEGNDGVGSGDDKGFSLGEDGEASCSGAGDDSSLVVGKGLSGAGVDDGSSVVGYERLFTGALEDSSSVEYDRVFTGTERVRYLLREESLSPAV